ncbi:MAG: hypothetical protein HYZ45_11590 [Burkholderiales bacterium]|nr:hypothetical protein [Burkholderiales bacterium]
MTSHPAEHGWLWLKQGLQLFRRNPGEMVALSLLYATVFTLLAALPLLGPFTALLLPTGVLVMMHACRQIAKNESVWSISMLQYFTPRALRPQVQLGIFFVMAVGLASMAAYGIFVVIGDEQSWQILSGQINAPKVQIDPVNMLAASTGAALVILPFLMALCFAPPLVSWRGMPLSKAIFYSFAAIWQSSRAFIIYGIGLIALFFTGIFFSALISFPLVLLFSHPVLIGLAISLLMQLAMLSIFFCTLYCTYEHVFAAEKLENLAAQ